MKNTILKFLIAFLIMDFVHAKPVMNDDSDFKPSNKIEFSINKFHELFKRAAEPGPEPITNGSNSSSKTGFSAMITTESKMTETQTEHKKTRKCLKWIKEPITNRRKCVNLVPNVVPKNEK